MLVIVFGRSPMQILSSLNPTQPIYDLGVAGGKGVAGGRDAINSGKRLSGLKNRGRVEPNLGGIAPQTPQTEGTVRPPRPPSRKG